MVFWIVFGAYAFIGVYTVAGGSEFIRELIAGLPFGSWGILIILLLTAISCTTPSIIATKEQQQGDYYNNLNQYDQAIQHYEQYLEASKQLGIYRNFDMEADVCRKVANAYSTQ